MKKLFANLFLLLVAAALGLLLGFALRRNLARDAGKREPEESTALAVSWNNTSPAAVQPVVRDDSPLATKLERNLALSQGVTRWLCWLDAMEKASAADFPRLFRLAQGNPAAVRLVSQRWVELYPRNVFDFVSQAVGSGRGMSSGVSQLNNLLFREWTKRDPEAVIAALNEEGGFFLRGARHTVAAAVMEKDPERGLQLFCDWNIENFGPRMTGVKSWAATDPRHAAEFALANPAGYATRLTMEAIGTEWGRTDPVRALEFAMGKPGEFSSILAQSVLKQWSDQNLNDAAHWLATVDPDTRNRLSPSFVESWARQDADGALTWCEQNLSGSSLAQAVGGVMKGAVQKDVASAGALVLTLNPSPARTEAAAVVGHKWFPDRLGDDIPVSAEAVKWLSSLDRSSAQRVLDDVQWSWATCDARSMAAFLKSSATEFSGSAYSILARELTRRNPGEGIAWVQGLPERYRSSAGCDAFAEWQSSQPEAAMKWLNELPSDDSRRQPYLENAIRSMAWDTQNWPQLAALPESQRAVARKVVDGMKLPEDRRVLLNALLDPPGGSIANRK